ncbi:Inositol phospholipid synthesis protein, Scs3p [Phaffia rhodozyma]|uniref:Inositol phospholipid synthesis protein, Scs3p n=1 Tax=Phaffia rhodozyma TaxID=264483 RepID=A0A0F7SRJ4_PHARH|nr:Inositol phospholipid synthesis protein, Scs3p [Phaffia rhodozyma]
MTSQPPSSGVRSRTKAASTRSSEDEKVSSVQDSSSSSPSSANSVVPYPLSFLSQPQRIALALILFVVVSGTVYSAVYSTATSPTASASQLLGEQGGTTLPRSETPVVNSYFAKKSNIFNRVFAKQAWLWTTLVYIVHLTLSPPPALTSSTRTHTKRSSVVKYITATLFWIILTLWAIGPSLFERTMIWSGGECGVVIPYSACQTGAIDCSAFDKAVGIGKGALVKIPGGFCHGGSSHRFTWDDLVFYLTSATTTSGAAAADASASAIAHGGAPVSGEAVINSLRLESIKEHFQQLRPHWSGGHDISGHVFLLTMSSMLILDLVWPGFKRIIDGKAQGMELGEKLATGFGMGVIALWTFILSKTALYFHTVLEKTTGMIIAIIGTVLFQYVGSIVY